MCDNNIKLSVKDESDNEIINNYITVIRYQEYQRHNIITHDNYYLWSYKQINTFYIFFY